MATSPAPGIRRLARAELPAGTVALARYLIGKTLVHEVEGVRLAGRIVETEAYLVGDAASHAFRGETKRNRSMFGERGTAYVYIANGVWPALNVASETPGIGAAVLLRAIEPIEGIEEMKRLRATERLPDLARGPGRLTAAMRVTLAEDGADLCGDGPLWLGSALRKRAPIAAAPRIGITKNAEPLLRFLERGSPFVSGPRRLIDG